MRGDHLACAIQQRFGRASKKAGKGVIKAALAGVEGRGRIGHIFG